jgi:hypothetical protein
MVRPDYCAIDHLQTRVATATVVKRFEQQLPQAGKRPTPELAVNRRPFAEVFVQITPGNAGSRNPENPIHNKAMIPRTTPTAHTHKWLKASPFLVTHQTTDHCSLLKSYLESDTTPFGNPLCQHILAIRSANPFFNFANFGGMTARQYGLRCPSPSQYSW